MFRIDRSSKYPRTVSVYTGNTCNLACTLCDPEASSRWRDELKMGKYIWADNLDQDFSNIDAITFGGGEPVLNKSTMLILQQLPNTINVMMHLNGTVLPSGKMFAELERFQSVQFILSIDDIKEQFEFLRYPAKWDQVVNNVRSLVNNQNKNTKFAVNTVVSILNEDTYHRVDEWAQEHMPPNTECFKQESNGRLNRFSKNFNRDLEFLNQLDLRRGTNWQKTFPTAVEKILSNITT